AVRCGGTWRPADAGATDRSTPDRLDRNSSRWCRARAIPAGQEWPCDPACVAASLALVVSSPRRCYTALPIPHTQAWSTSIIGGAPRGSGISHHRRRDVALLGKSSLLFPLQGHPPPMDFAQRGKPGRI